MLEMAVPVFSQINFPGASTLISMAWIIGGVMCLKYGVVFVALWNLKHPGNGETPLQPEELHPEVRRHLQPWLTRLAEFGFAGPCFYQMESHSRLERVFCRVTHAGTKSIAELRIVILPSGVAPRIMLGFYNFLSDGRVLVTGETGTCDHWPAHWLALFKRFTRIDEQWATHQSRLKELAPLATAISPEDPAGAMAAQHAATDQASVDAGLLERDPGGGTGFRVRRAGIPGSALKVLKFSLPGLKVGSVKRADLALPAIARPDGGAGGLPPGTNPEDGVERDLMKYHQAVGGNKKGMGRWAKLALLAVTLGLFASFWKGGNLGGMTVMIIGTLFLHEFGHWLPMKLFGYKNVTMFFIPGFGAAVSGKKQHAPAWQELVVLLGGPLPGLVGGIAVMVIGYFFQGIPDFWLNAAGLAVIINAFNLLPFLPLDGGKIVDLLIFKDVPWLRLLFNGFSTLCVIVACFLPGMGALRYLAIVMALGLVRDVKMFKIRKAAGKVEWAGQVDDEDTALRRIFRELREGGNSNFVGSADWLPRTQVVIEEVLRKRPGWWVRLGGLGFYGAVCLFPLLFFVTLGVVLASGVLTKSAGGAEHLAELRRDLPEIKIDLTAEKMAPLNKLAVTTEMLLLDAEDEPSGVERVRRIARSFPEEAGREVDFVHWEHVRDFQSLGDSGMETVNVWLETACLRMEMATDGGKFDEGCRRSEIVLYAIRSLEPAVSCRQREQLWEAQVRVLKNIAKLTPSGAVTPAIQDRLKSGIQALRNPPDAAVEAFLLVDGWRERELLHLNDGPATPDLQAARQDDASACRTFYRQLDELKKGRRTQLPTCVAVARIWKTHGAANELPAEPPAGVQVTPAEADFLHGFCDRKREIVWLQQAVLYTMNLNDYQKQHGQFLPRWNHAVPGGGMMEFVAAPAPVLRLTDVRNEAQRAGPGWLGRHPDEAQPPVDFPLQPVAATTRGVTSKSPPQKAGQGNGRRKGD